MGCGVIKIILSTIRQHKVSDAFRFDENFQKLGQIFISRKTERFGKYHGHLAYITDLHLEIKTEAP